MLYKERRRGKNPFLNQNSVLDINIYLLGHRRYTVSAHGYVLTSLSRYILEKRRLIF